MDDIAQCNRCRKIVAAALALFLLVSASPNADQLTTGEFDQADGRDYYRQIVTTVLHEGYAEDVRARMLVLSVSGESLIGLRARGRGFQVFVLRPTIQLWWYEVLRDMKNGSYKPPQGFPSDLAAQAKDLEASLPRDYRDVPVEKCVAALHERVANRLVAAWQRVLTRAQPSPPSDERIVLDGAHFHFWVRGERELAGHVLSPDPAWRSYQLAGIGSEMYKFCNTPTAAGAEKLRRLADDVR